MDLTGPSGGWTAETRAMWQRCLGQAFVTATGAVWETLPRSGLPELREAFGRKFAADPAHLRITSGIRSEVATLMAGARRIVVEQPGFTSIRLLAGQLGYEVVPATWEQLLDGDLLTPDSVMWLTSPARNPDGRTLTTEEAERLDGLSASCRRLVLNMAYYWASPDAPVPTSATRVGSLHKIAGGGCAVGWVVDPGREPVHRPAGGGPPTAWQLAWAAFVAEGGLDQLAEVGLRAPSRRCSRLAFQLARESGLRVAYGAGPSMTIASPHLNEERLLATLAEVGVRAGAGSNFDQPGQVRLCLTGVMDDDVDVCARRIIDATS